MSHFFLDKNYNFFPFSLQHLLVVISLFLLGFIIIAWAKKQSIKNQTLIGNFLAWSIALTVISDTALKFFFTEFNYQEDLPLHLCRFLALIVPLLSMTKKYVYFEVLFFLILSGTFQAIITPSDYNFMNFAFFRYWWMHGGLIVFMLYVVFVYQMKPTLKSVFKSFLAMQIYMVMMFVVNYFLGSNYFYTNRKPDAATLLDVLGGWPTYIFIIELIVIPYFLLIYLPFYLTRKNN